MMRVLRIRREKQSDQGIASAAGLQPGHVRIPVSEGC